MHDGKFFPVACDQAIVYPMIEMSREHAFFVPDVLYEWNCVGENHNFKIKPTEQQAMAGIICRKHKYAKLRVHPSKY